MRYLLFLPLVWLFVSCGDDVIIEEASSIYKDEGTFLECLYKEIRYPAKARENGVEGLVRISIILNEEGYGQIFTILEDPGCGLGEASIDALRFCTTNYQQFNLSLLEESNGYRRVEIPVTFKLEG
jgi:protein TonB